MRRRFGVAVLFQPLLVRSVRAVFGAKLTAHYGSRQHPASDPASSVIGLINTEDADGAAC